MDDYEPAYCDGCGTGKRVNWCPVYGEYLCPQCLWNRNEQELKPTGLLADLPAEPICDCCPAPG